MQLFPYGWQFPNGTVIREEAFSGMVAAANASHRRWVNPDAQNAFFRKCGSEPMAERMFPSRMGFIL